MTNLKTIRAFVNKEEGHSLHIISENNKLFSYATCIAQWYDDKIIINCTIKKDNIHNLISLTFFLLISKYTSYNTIRKILSSN